MLKETKKADFVDNLLVLIDEWFPELQVEAKKQLTLSCFFDQLESPQISFAVSNISQEM